MATLLDIETKVRRITRMITEDQLSTPILDTYINNFILYDMPNAVKLFGLRTTVTFWTQPNLDTYSSTNANPADPLFNFKNVYNAIFDPFYIGGFRAWYSQSREDFFGQWPFVNSQLQIATGDGVTTNFVGFLTNPPVLQNNVTFSSIDANNNALTLNDIPQGNTNGNIQIPSTGAVVGTIDYVTGAFNITFPTAPAQNIAIFSQVVPYQPAIPTSILYYDYTFTLRPVPDISYPVNFEAYIRPTALIGSGTIPQLEQWWQFIALGAAKKIFEDRTDYESVNALLPTFQEQLAFVQRSTLVQQDHERSTTIYSQQSSLAAGPFGWGNQSGFNF